jgi:hypothetical protein
VAHYTLDTESTAALFNNPLGYRQAEPCAAHSSRTNFVGTPKPVEDVRQVFRNDAYPVFADADDYVVRVGM